MRYLTLEEITFFNIMNIKRHSPGEQIGVKDLGLLESALGRPVATFGSEDLYPTVFLKAAALMESLAQNHPFHNANKRTAFSATVTFLKFNDYDLEVDHDQAVQYTMDVTNGNLSIEESADFLEQHCAPRGQQKSM